MPDMSTFRDENPHWKPAPSGTQFFKKSKKRSETRFGPLLMSSGRLVLFSGESEHFFFRRKCGSENKKKSLKNSNGWFNGQNHVKSSSKDPPHRACTDRPIKKILISWFPVWVLIPERWCLPGDWCYFQANLSTFFFVENVGQKIKKRFKKILTAEIFKIFKFWFQILKV